MFRPLLASAASAALLASNSVVVVGSSVEASASPVGKVIELMSTLESKVIGEGETAQKLYSEFSEYCEDRARELSHEIKVGNEEVGQLKATIASSDASIEELKAKIDGFVSDIATAEGELKDATEVRAKEQKDFQAEEKELTETISMLGRATSILEREMAKETPSFIQARETSSFTAAMSALVSASFLSTADVEKLTSLAQTSEGDESDQAPEAAVYESKSGNVVETLKGLADKAEAQLASARKEETTSLHNFEMTKQSLEDEIRFATKDLEEAKKNLAIASETKASATGDLETTSKELSTDTESKEKLHHDCMSRATDFETETKSRAEELKALAEAKKVIKEATGGAEALVYSDAASFLQTSAKTSSSVLDKARRLVRTLAHQNNDKALALLAERIGSVAHSGSRDVFAKVKGLISDLIAKLEEAASADQQKKAYCDKELKETTEKKDEKTAEVEKLSTSIDKMSAESKALQEEIAALQKALANLGGSEAEMDSIRTEDHKAFVQSSADLKQGLEGVKMALKVLNDYYGTGGTMSDSSSSIIGLLEVVESDFSKNLAEIQTEEEAAAANYESGKKNWELEKTTKTKDVEYKTKASAKLDKDASALSAEKSTVDAELEAILDYLSKITAQCTDKVETYEERKARREAELEGLKSALDILSAETGEALIQKSSRAARRVHQLRGPVGALKPEQ
mmetsp:Transcript_6008/g.13933  ORF Transcript_6008/g.13933 Transcript_6008/m.13933 type:complete len:692 (-) Transcript_6008:116-2191(-)